MSPRTQSATIALVMVASFLLALLITPRNDVPIGSVVLETMIPAHFGAWTQQEDSVVQVATELDRTTGAENQRPVYDQTLMRTYKNGATGQIVMLALAYGRQQRQELKIHRPELCYYGQGFEVTALGKRSVILSPTAKVTAQTLMTRNRARLEPVTYWIRIGHEISQSAWQTRWSILRDGLAGSVPDGILVRVSSLVQSDAQSESALKDQEVFLSDMFAVLSPTAREVIGGA